MVTDLTMPSMSGSDLVLKGARTKPELPILLITNYVGENMPGDIPPLVKGTVSKPFTRSEFFHALKSSCPCTRTQSRMRKFPGKAEVG